MRGKALAMGIAVLAALTSVALTSLALTGVALTGVAFGHAALNATEAEAGALTTLQFRITHGCGDSPTVRVRLTLPPGVSRVTPRVVPGWTVAVTHAPLEVPLSLHGQTVMERVDTITWSGGEIPSFAYEQFEVRLATPNEPGRTLLFAARQECANGGSYDWADDPAAGPTEHPALMLTLTEPPMPVGHAHH
ncbi:MAG: YcnI family protein [Caulobacterales bacterium]